MYFKLGFCSAADLAEAERRAVRAHWPHLVLVSLMPDAALEVALSNLASHVRAVVLPAIGSAQVIAVLRSLAAAELQLPPGTPLLDWDDVENTYQAWMHQVYLPFQRQVCPYDPEGLRPISEPPEHLNLEVIGSCTAEFLTHYAPIVVEQLETKLTVQHVIQNHPVTITRFGNTPDIQIVIPPLRYMHPQTFDDFMAWDDYDRKFEESVVHMYRYLDTIVNGMPCSQRYVTNFMEPFSNPLG